MTDETLNDLMIDPTEDLWWVFYLREAQTHGAMECLTEQLVERGMHVVRKNASALDFQVILRDDVGDMYLELSTPSDDTLPYVFLGTLAERFLAIDSAASRLLADRFLEYGKVCYAFLQPLYAFAESLNTHIERVDIDGHRITHVCWAQFFGPNFVEGFGEKTLRHAPAWRNENMGDGGLLYVLAAEPYLSRGPRQYWRQAREHFTRYVSYPVVWLDEAR